MREKPNVGYHGTPLMQLSVNPKRYYPCVKNLHCLAFTSSFSKSGTKLIYSIGG